jgi:fatty-acyl-CoA synthase
MTDAVSTVPALLDPPDDIPREATAAIVGTDHLTFADVRDRSARAAAALYRDGVRAGDAVAIWLPNCSAWIELQFALAHLGALLICVNTRYRSHELGGVLSRSRAKWLVLQPEFRGIDFLSILSDTSPEERRHLRGVIVHGASDDAIPLPAVKVTAYAALHDTERPEPPVNAAGPEQPCIAFTSSGSTGVPKLIVHNQRSISEHARAVADRFFDYENATALVTLPLSGVFGYTTFMGAFAAGRRSILMDAFEADRAVELIERHRVTTITGPDEVMLRILDAAEPRARIESWREGGYGAQSVDSKMLITRGDGAGVELFQCYGSSECLGLTSRQPRGAPSAERRLGGGVPVSPLTEVRVRSDETGELLPPGTPGLLEIRGPSVMSGYLHQRDATSAAFTDDGWFRTGDIGYRVGDSNRFVFLTRNHDVLRLAGFLVEPREIEHFIELLDGVAAAQVVEVRTDRGARVVAFTIPVAGAEVAEADVVEHCAASLAKYKVPVRVFTVDSFPRTSSANGEKVQRGKLRELANHLMSETAQAH